ncbi:2-C-methyl-D-erythritol 4-phosphate cytidylyltransferase [Angustibacter aerolatus]
MTLLEHAVARVRTSGAVGHVVAVVPDELHARAVELLPGTTVVTGGADRSASVAAGLQALPDRCAVVLVHDAARCLAPPELVAQVVEATRRLGAVVPGLPLVDTVKRVDAAGRVLDTPDRAGLRAVQTPQGFDRALLERAHEAGRGSSVTDDAGLVERLGEPVHVVPGHPLALKITTADDLGRAAQLLADADAPAARMGS